MIIKKLLVLLLLIILPIIIYITNIDHKIYYLALGDSLAAGHNPYGKLGYGYSDYVSDYLKGKKKLEFYTKHYAVSGYRTTDLIRDINDNKEVLINNKVITLKNALTNADLITLSIGANDLFYKLNLTNINTIFEDEIKLMGYVNGVINDIEKVIILLKKYCKEDIILIGYYNPLWQINKDYATKAEPYLLEANQQMKSLAKKYNLFYVDIYQTFKDNKDYLPNPLDIHPSIHGYQAIADKIIAVIDQNILN